MTVVANTLSRPDGSPAAGVRVDAVLRGGSWATAGGEIVGKASTVSGPDGSWQLTLTPTTAVEGSAYYEVREGDERWTVAVPDSVDPVQLHDVLTVVAATGEAFVGLTQAVADTLYEPIGGGTGGTGGITQTQGDARYTQRSLNLSDVGSASAARANLGLGTAATQPSTAFDAAGAATAAVAAHAAAADPHPVYATDSDLTTGLAGKANTAHTHVEADVTGLTADLASKAAAADLTALDGRVTSLEGFNRVLVLATGAPIPGGTPAGTVILRS